MADRTRPVTQPRGRTPEVCVTGCFSYSKFPPADVKLKTVPRSFLFVPPSMLPGAITHSIPSLFCDSLPLIV